MSDIRSKIYERGQSLFEVFLSLAIVAIIIVALVILASNAIRNSTYSKNKTLATRYSQEATEWLRGERDAGWDDFSKKVLAFSYYCLQTLTWAPGECGTSDTISNTSLIREVQLTIDNIPPPPRITAEVVVYWEDSQGVHDIKSTTDFTDWRTQ